MITFYRRALLMMAAPWLGGCLAFHTGPMDGEPEGAAFAMIDGARIRYRDEGRGPMGGESEEEEEEPLKAEPIGQKLDESEVFILNTSSVVSSNGLLDEEDERQVHQQSNNDPEHKEPEIISPVVEIDEQDGGNQQQQQQVLESRSDVSCNLSQVSSLSRSHSSSSADSSPVHTSIIVEGV